MPPADRTEEARRRTWQEYVARDPRLKRPPESLKRRLSKGFLVYGIGKPMVWTYTIILAGG